jgi:hypothetical protein
MPKLKPGDLSKQEIIKDLVETVGGSKSLWNVCPPAQLRLIYSEVKLGNTAGVRFALEQLEKEKLAKKQLAVQNSLLQSQQRGLIQRVADAQEEISEIKVHVNATFDGMNEIIDKALEVRQPEDEAKEEYNLFQNILISLKSIVTFGYL